MQSIFESIEFKKAENLSKHTTFRIGGPAKYFFMPSNTEELIAILEYCRANNEQYMILGNGSNVLFSDEGYDGAIIQIYTSMSDIKLDGDRIYAQSGALLSRIANAAKDNSLTGMEFAAGIPGTLGGAVVMNAGAYGGEMKDIIEYVDILDKNYEVIRYTCDEMEFGYRHSIVDSDKIVLGAALKLSKGDIEQITQEMNRLKEARVSKQPLEFPSAGSTFKRPEGYFAGKLIEDSGLKGYTLGGAMVSDKHCGFVINHNNASCKDVLALIEHVKETVKEKYNVILEPEVKIIP